MRTNTDITVYNKYIVSREAVYQRTVVAKAMWQGVDGTKLITSGGQLSDDKAAIYIPSSNRPAHLDPVEWQELVDKSDKWTLQNGDYIVKGSVSDEITALFTISDLKAKYNDVLVITNVKKHDYGSASMQHWKIGAK